MKAPDTFVDAVIAKQAKLEDIDDWVDEWHEEDTGKYTFLYQCLGMTPGEYAAWVSWPQCLECIIAEHRKLTHVVSTNQEAVELLQARELAAAVFGTTDMLGKAVQEGLTGPAAVLALRSIKNRTPMRKHR